jgi:hypothetical protein
MFFLGKKKTGSTRHGRSTLGDMILAGRFLSHGDGRARNLAFINQLTEQSALEYAGKFILVAGTRVEGAFASRKQAMEHCRDLSEEECADAVVWYVDDPGEACAT